MRYTVCTSLFALILTVAVPPVPAQSPGQAALPPPPPPIPHAPSKAGREATRWEPWSAMRTAALPLLGWRIGISTTSFPNSKLIAALQHTDALSLASVEASSTQQVSEQIPKQANYSSLQPGEIPAIQDKLFALDMQMTAYRVPSLGTDEDAARKTFDFAKGLQVNTIVVEHMPENPAALDKLANEYDMNIALCGNVKTVMAAVEGLSRHIGICGDTGIWMQEGLKPVDALAQIKDRLLILGLRDRSALGASGHDVALGSGVGNLPEFLRQMDKMQIKPALMTVDATATTDVMANLAHQIDSFEEVLRPIMADRVDEISRTTAIRGPDRLSAEDKARIDAALPATAPAKPKKPRKLLVMDLNVDYGGHRSIPAENYALEMMGKKTGAYEAVFSDDLDNLKYPRIKEYDAIFLNNTVGMIFVDPLVREGLVRFIKEGGGLGGNHGTSHASMDWPEFHDMIGVTRGVHRQNTEKFWVKIDDPKSPLTQAFHGKEFEYQDEFFRFVNPPYSREKLHILLSMDVAKTDMNQGTPFMPGSLDRPDADYAVSWIHDYGKGHVFFCILGHNATLFDSPEIAQYFLAGIQYMLGDLQADATPSAKLATH